MGTRASLYQQLAFAEAELARMRARESTPVCSPPEAAELIRKACSSKPEQETFVVVLLDARQRPLSVEIAAVGTLNEVTIYPRDVFREAVRMCAHSIIIGHNHPSGTTTPSPADISITERLIDAGKILGIPVVDHIIVTRDRHLSMLDRISWYLS